MKSGTVIKNAGSFDAAEEMMLVNQYSRRQLSEEEVYLFSIALCDNDVDRDYERFTVESLFALEKLFVGKTGIFDHDPTAKNQRARIISCKVEAVEGRKTAIGDDLFRLTARAYIPRTEGNAELIEMIDAGIVKEASVGCSIGRTVCSVCRQDIHSPACSHVKGRVYQGELCFGELCDPSDAYEFSFVAVPAQRAAGVIKSEKKEKTMLNITKLLASERATLEGGEIAELKAYIDSLKSDAQCAKAYRADLLQRLEDGLREKGVEPDYDTAKSIAEKLSIGEIRALLAAVQKTAAEQPAPQLSRVQRIESNENTEFRI